MMTSFAFEEEISESQAALAWKSNMSDWEVDTLDGSDEPCTQSRKK